MIINELEWISKREGVALLKHAKRSADWVRFVKHFIQAYYPTPSHLNITAGKLPRPPHSNPSTPPYTQIPPALSLRVKPNNASYRPNRWFSCKTFRRTTVESEGWTNVGSYVNAINTPVNTLWHHSLQNDSLDLNQSRRDWWKSNDLTSMYLTVKSNMTNGRWHVKPDCQTARSSSNNPSVTIPSNQSLTPEAGHMQQIFTHASPPCDVHVQHLLLQTLILIALNSYLHILLWTDGPLTT